METFFPPKIQTHDSWSTSNLHNTATSSAKIFDVITLEDLYKASENLKNSQYRLLKMDIEGLELELIRVICESQYKFDFLAIEMDFLSLIPFLQFRKRLKLVFKARLLLQALQKSGYELIKTENFNFCWIHK